MRVCIYCRQLKPEEDFSLEHVIPQCLGGATAPDDFKTRDVCKKCNNDLGLFVDAAFEKSWFVSMQLQENARAQFNPLSPKAIPLVCMGPCELEVPGLQADEVCESWLGPFGEQVYWLRPRDERLYWYSGGNPRTVKSANSRAYFMFSINSKRSAGLTWLSFEKAFSGRRVKKIMCTQVSGADPKSIGFSEPDSLDEARVDFFMSHSLTGSSRKISLAIYTRFDLRFMAKLAIGLSHCLYEKTDVCKDYAYELHRALWHRPGEELPLINASTSFSTEIDPRFSEITGIRGAVVLLVTRVPSGTAVVLNLGPRLNWFIKIAEHVNEPSSYQDQVIIIFSALEKCFRMPLQDYIAFKCNALRLPGLDEIINQIQSTDEYFAKLSQT
jgi:HNH endonuclease